LLIVLLVIGAPMAIAIATAKSRVNSAGQPEGFGGWLMLLAIGQTLTPLRSPGDFVGVLPDYQQVMTIEHGSCARLQRGGADRRLHRPAVRRDDFHVP
jgi:hypothetical protein